MDEKDKKLLFIDISGRVAYHIKVRAPYDNASVIGLTHRKGVLNKKEYQYIDIITDKQTYPIQYVKPYLRPMSSMTEAERNEYFSLKMQETERVALAEIERPEAVSEILDWLNSHYFDYRDLISKRLALEAPEQMYKF